MIAGLIDGFGVSVRQLSILWDWLVKKFHGPKVRRIFSEFCAEVAVLVAVFPILDTVLGDHGNSGGGIHNVTWSLGLWSAFFVIIFLVAAVIIAE